MSTYVFSDVHGHRATLERALAQVPYAPEDHFFCLGDMIDRGPDSVGVMRLVRSLPNVRVLMGNHEDLMISCLDSPDDEVALMNWGINGGGATSDRLAEADPAEADELVSWVRGLPRWAWVRVGGRPYILVHGGVRLTAPVPPTWDDASLDAYLSEQDPEDLAWIREDFWGAPEGLSGADGSGPIVVCGHTPTVYLSQMTSALDRPATDEEGRTRMVRVGATDNHRDVDCAAAAGAGIGQVLVLRLDDGAEFYEPVLEGE